MIDRIYRHTGMMFVALLVLILAPILVAWIIHEAGPVAVLGVMILASLWAYFTRRRRSLRQPRARQIAGAERTPVMPHEEER